ncbi:hypothetical protein PV325_011179 [Microctonus aethiopoides]|uniref:tRNA-splicing endonuclease subunit Sen34 n=1 Tax=Microctonus aethiopoides TaxID=144406 RepID=A0AA39F810_9HYME|nr:hypothetical protein PV325_011179 [Microctonus aethiopoides]KAK0094914.1 hypothetical protein PV326_009633 [Microctonus aethiopoides]KAK0164536.1 hypothetical protein PV328_003153 [Microctonus aethiopoides]
MIDLALSNGQVFVWNAEDWLTLRKDYRITGELVGCLPSLPRQEIFHGLPLLLSPEEVTLLLEKKIARLVELPCLQQKPSSDLMKAFNSYRKKMLIEQEECLVETRKAQIVELMDKIVDGKRRKLLGLKSTKKELRKPLDDNTAEAIKNVEIDRDALFAEEMKKIPKLDPAEALVQIHTAYPWTKKEDIREAEWNYPQSPEDKLRCRVYKDLWEKEFYITPGDKFGGDFLVYPGDPIMFHSQFVVQCKDKNEDITILDLSGQCRVACHVRKTMLYAYLSDDEQNIIYQSFHYENSNMI